MTAYIIETMHDGRKVTTVREFPTITLYTLAFLWRRAQRSYITVVIE